MGMVWFIAEYLERLIMYSFKTELPENPLGAKTIIRTGDRFLTPPPAAKGYFNKEVNKMTAEFIQKMEKHKEDIIRNYEKFEVYLKNNNINYKKLSPRNKIKLKKDLGVTDASMNIVNDMGRMFASLDTTNPEFAREGIESFAEAVEKGLKEPNASKARKAFRAWQTRLEKLADKGKFLVGHHGSPLKGIWKSVRNAPKHLKKPMLQALEDLYGFQLGEGSLVDILTIAHTQKSQSELAPAWIKALDGVENLDDYNPNIKPKIMDKLAHAGRFGGTTQLNWMPPPHLLRGIKSAEEGATLLRPYLDATKAMSDQGEMTSNAIAKVLFKGGEISPETIIPSALKPGGAVEQVIDKVPKVGINRADEILMANTARGGRVARRLAWMLPVGGASLLLTQGQVIAREQEVAENPNDPYLQFQLTLDKRARDLDAVGLGATAVAPVTGGTSLVAAGAAEVGSFGLGLTSSAMDFTRYAKSGQLNEDIQNIWTELSRPKPWLTEELGSASWTL